MSNVYHIEKTSISEQRKREFRAWNRLKPVYFQTWVWEEVCKRFPEKYKMILPTYQDKKVILT